MTITVHVKDMTDFPTEVKRKTYMRYVVTKMPSYAQSILNTGHYYGDVNTIMDIAKITTKKEKIPK
jgi:hypothetical protein